MSQIGKPLLPRKVHDYTCDMAQLGNIVVLFDRLRLADRLGSAFIPRLESVELLFEMIIYTP